jgi:myosin phosphatase Rho-interacting protein
MNKVMEVARADEVTGNPYSVAITAPERIHFVKGTCKEESNWWLEVLQIFPAGIHFAIREGQLLL